MTVAVIVLGGVLAAVFLPLGAAKVAAVPRMREAAAHAGFSVRAYRGIGALEIAGALGVLVGIQGWPIGVAAGTGLVALMTGAVAVHVRRGDAVARFAPAAAIGVLAAGYVLAARGAIR